MIHVYVMTFNSVFDVFFFQAEDGIRDLVRSRGLGDVYKRQELHTRWTTQPTTKKTGNQLLTGSATRGSVRPLLGCLLYTSDAADERSSVDLGGRRIIKKKNEKQYRRGDKCKQNNSKCR